MKLVLNFRDGVAPLALDLHETEEEVLDMVRAAITGGEILDLSDARGERLLIPAASIAYVMVPSRQTSPVGFGRM